MPLKPPKAANIVGMLSFVGLLFVWGGGVKPP